MPQQAPSPRIFSPGLGLGYGVKLPNVVCSLPLGRSAPSHMSCPVCTLRIVCRWEGSVVHCVQAGKGSTLDLKISAAVNPSVVYCSNSNRSFFQPALPSISFVLLVLSCFFHDRINSSLHTHLHRTHSVVYHHARLPHTHPYHLVCSFIAST